MAAENYHLKWDSHLSYLNSSVATLYKNEKFADVMLYSSSSSSNACSGAGVENGIPTVGISAHKFILSSCSQFFAAMFESSPVASPLGVLYVVLPPELSHRAIQILVQYMYSGEATVSNDILSEVLRGGELLKIRGLCRTASSHAHSQSLTSNASHYGPAGGGRNIAPPGHSAQPTSNTHVSEMYGSKCSSSRFSFVEHQQQQFRGLGASVMPKDSPVIVKSPKMPQMTLLPSSASKLSSAGGGVGISINKEVAIDPEDKSDYQAAQEGLASNAGGSLCPGMGCRSCSISAAMETQQLRQRRQSSASDDHLAPHNLMTEHVEQDYAEPLAMPDHCGHLDGEESPEDRVMEYERRLRSDSTDHGGSFYLPGSYEHPGNSSKNFTEPTNRLTNSPLQPHNFLNIKQEPNDWPASAHLDSSTVGSRHPTNTPPSPSMLSPKQPLDFKMPLGTVKIETSSSHSADEDEAAAPTTSCDYNTFTRLVCEVCKKAFDDPKSWVRHLESHAPSGLEIQQQSEPNSGNCGTESLPKTYVPKKRRRVSQQENSMDHVTLLCDICATSFETPAEWVRHMNNQHTEIELAMFNSKKDNDQPQQRTKTSQTNSSGPTSTTNPHNKKAPNRASSLGYMEYSEKICDICNKKFPSNSNMLLHKRSHVTTSSSSSLNAVASSVSTLPDRQQQSNGISNREMNCATPTA